MTTTLPLQELVALFARDPLTVDDIVGRVGPVKEDAKAPMPLVLEPRLPGVRTAFLWRYPDSGLPYLLRLEPTADVRPSVAELKSAFGDYRRLRSDIETPVRIAFSPPLDAPRWAVTVIAELSTKAEPVQDAAATSITLRRDPI